MREARERCELIVRNCTTELLNFKLSPSSALPIINIKKKVFYEHLFNLTFL